MPFAKRYALLLPEAPANSEHGSNGLLLLTSSGFVDWFALSEAQVGVGGRAVQHSPAACTTIHRYTVHECSIFS
jgi:hypothetical protein